MANINLNVTGPIACNNWIPINITGNTQIITAGAGRFVGICSIDLLSAAAENIALVEGTGSTCGTSTVGMAGGATAATGWNFGANGGIAHGTGVGIIAATAVAGDNVCLLISGSTQVSGVIGWTLL